VGPPRDLTFPDGRGWDRTSDLTRVNGERLGRQGLEGTVEPLPPLEAGLFPHLSPALHQIAARSQIGVFFLKEQLAVVRRG
jgi:hypothetical protein